MTDKQVMKQPFPMQEVSIDNIDLDIRNSRFPRDAENQKEAFELMMETAGDDCLELLRDITKNGALNSSDLPIVVGRNDRYIMMEGNRRLICLMLWNNPDKLSIYPDLNKRYASRVMRLISDSDFSPPTSLRVVIAPNETEADIWVDRKHTGGSGGAGTVEWGPAMKDRRKARKDPSKTTYALAFIDCISQVYKQERDVMSALEEVRAKRYTMIQRFAERSVVKEIVGLEFNSGKMSLRYGPKATLPIIRQVITDFACPKAPSNKSWSRELDTNDDFKKYLQNHKNLLPTDKIISIDVEEKNYTSHSDAQVIFPNSHSEYKKYSATPQHDSFKKDESENSAVMPEKNRPPRPTRQPDNIFKDLHVSNFSQRTVEIIRLTSRLSLSKQTEIVGVMLRVILDLTTYQFLKSHGKEVPRNLDSRIKDSIKIIDPQAPNALGQAEDTSALQKAFHATQPNTIRLVQYVVHDSEYGHTPNEASTLAKRYEPVIKAMDSNMGEHEVQ